MLPSPLMLLLLHPLLTLLSPLKLLLLQAK
jgi:hypothetical protein